MTEINPLVNSTLAGRIAKELDKKDGKEDGKISASVWNEFVADKGGKQIKYSITVENAMNSITTYAVRNQSNEVPVDDLAEKWFNKEVEFNKNNPPAPPVVETAPAEVAVPIVENATDVARPEHDPNGPPVNDPNPPVGMGVRIPESTPPMPIDLYPPREEFPNPALANKKVELPNGGFVEYDGDGFSRGEYDENGNHTRSIDRTDDGGIIYYRDYEYDENGNCTRKVCRNPDGSIEYYTDFEDDENGNNTRAVVRNPDGSIDTIVDREYDENGNRTREVRRNPDGSIDHYYDFEYDENGNETRHVYRNPDGSIEYYKDSEYDENGNKTRHVYRNPDGSIDE